MSKNWLHDPIYFAPTAKLGGGWIAHKDSPSPPAQPDYTGAAQATAAGNRVSQYTPYGSQVYTPDPNYPGQFQANITLNPQAQQTLDANLGMSAGLGNLALDQLPRVADQYSQPMDLSSVGETQDKAYQAMTSRLDPQWQQREQEQEVKLRNQGLVPGGEAYDNAMRTFNEGRNDAYQQANLGAIQTAPQTYQLANAQYMQPLNTLNAIRTGAQVQNPQFGSTPAGANYLGAAQAQGQGNMGLYNAEAGQANAFNQGLFSLGSAAIGLSDRRLKSNIKQIGMHPLGIGIYEYDILGARDVGVMAQDVLMVKPEAVIQHPSGFLMVDYGRL